MHIFFLALLLGMIPAYIAKSKGRSFNGWWVYGVALFIPATIHALLIHSNVDRTTYLMDNNLKECQHCFGEIDVRATTCQHCGKEI